MTAASSATPSNRKLLGAWYTPPELVDEIVAAVVTPSFVRTRAAARPPVTVLDPACGDGRFLVAAARRIVELGGEPSLVGVDVDASAVAAARTTVPNGCILHADALTRHWDDPGFDIVIGNPPFLSQLSRATTRGGAGRAGVGTYGDVAAEFLGLAAELVDRQRGRVAMVLPQSMLSSRDARGVRRRIDEQASLMWSWWSPEQLFDAQVVTCALAFDFARRDDDRPAGNWTQVVTARQAVPELAPLATDGTLGDRATANANFRDQYYGLVGAVVSGGDGPPLVTSGVIDPGRLLWGERPITFNRQRYEHPRVRIDALGEAMSTWAARRLVPKVLVANQTAILEAVADIDGRWLPGVPVVGLYPTGVHWDDADAPPADVTTAVWRIAAVLTSPVASAWLWHQRAGSGLSGGTVRVSPSVLAELPWPAGPLDPAVAALRSGDVRSCGHAVDVAYGITDDQRLAAWWERSLERIEARSGGTPGTRAAAGATPRQPG